MRKPGFDSFPSGGGLHKHHLGIITCFFLLSHSTCGDQHPAPSSHHHLSEHQLSFFTFFFLKSSSQGLFLKCLIPFKERLYCQIPRLIPPRHLEFLVRSTSSLQPYVLRTAAKFTNHLVLVTRFAHNTINSLFSAGICSAFQILLVLFD